MKKASVTVTLTRPNAWDGDYFEITVRDEKALVQILSVKIPVDRIGDLISSRQCQGEAEVLVSDRIGKTRVSKDISLKLHVDMDTKDALKVAADEYEEQNPGWKVDTYYTYKRFNRETYVYKTNAYSWE